MNTATAMLQVNERRMDCEFTVAEIERLYILAIRERASSNDKNQEDVNLARKLLAYKRRAGTTQNS